MGRTGTILLAPAVVPQKESVSRSQVKSSSSSTENAATENAVRSALRERGLRCTGERVAVLSTLTEAAGHLTVSDIHERIRATGQQVDLSTVYRTVTMLQELDLVHAVALPDQAVTYGVVEAAHHHAVCTSCQLIAEVPAAVLAGVLADAVELAQAATGYTLEHGSLQLHGLCARCYDEASTQPFS